MNSFAKLITAVFMMLLFSGCAQMGTKQESFPSMYTDKKPVTILVVPGAQVRDHLGHQTSHPSRTRYATAPSGARMSLPSISSPRTCSRQQACEQ